MIPGHQDPETLKENGEVSKMGDHVAQVTATMAEQAKTIRAERAERASAQDQVLQSLNRVQTKLNRLETENSEQVRLAAAPKSAFEESAKQYTTLESRMTALANSSAEASLQLKSTIADLRNSFANEESAVIALRNETTSIRASIDPVRTNQNEITNRLRALENSMAKTGSTLSEIDKRLTRLESLVAELRKPSWLRRMLDRITGEPGSRNTDGGTTGASQAFIDTSEKTLHLFGVRGFEPTSPPTGGSSQPAHLSAGNNEITAELNVDRIVFKTPPLGSISCSSLGVEAAGATADQGGVPIPELDRVTLTSSSGSVAFLSERMNRDARRILKAKLEEFCFKYKWR